MRLCENTRTHTAIQCGSIRVFVWNFINQISVCHCHSTISYHSSFSTFPSRIKYWRLKRKRKNKDTKRKSAKREKNTPKSYKTSKATTTRNSCSNMKNIRNCRCSKTMMKSFLCVDCYAIGLCYVMILIMQFFSVTLIMQFFIVTQDFFSSLGKELKNARRLWKAIDGNGRKQRTIPRAAYRVLRNQNSGLVLFFLGSGPEGADDLCFHT